MDTWQSEVSRSRPSATAALWRAEPLPPAVLGDLASLLQALRRSRPKAGRS